MFHVEIDGTKLKVYSDGSIYRKMKSNNWKEIENKANHIKGYNVILINKRQYMRAKIVAFVFLEQNLYDNTFFVCHKDNDKLNCDQTNLYIKNKK